MSLTSLLGTNLKIHFIIPHLMTLYLVYTEYKQLQRQSCAGHSHRQMLGHRKYWVCPKPYSSHISTSQIFREGYLAITGGCCRRPWIVLLARAMSWPHHLTSCRNPITGVKCKICFTRGLLNVTLIGCFSFNRYSMLSKSSYKTKEVP
jgi:hypothetical protein